ncbi:radical SAM protein [Actinomadura sp. KC216]|uniref:B12-binding domain-containing radical SAM protein n=1 Tax=Actinomadura sp. KC216 TaxID=2530370 RepID=UPI001404B01B|nr:radical SAM protein [Actinomadura sp. KC216]
MDENSAGGNSAVRRYAERPRRLLLAQLYGLLQPANAEPLSVATLAAHVDSLDVELPTFTTIVNPAIDPDAVDRLLATIRRDGHDLVGLSVPQGTFETAKRILLGLRTFPSARRPEILLGHALPTHIPHRFLAIEPRAIVMRGWAETALEHYIRARLANTVDCRELPGVAFSEGNRVIVTPLAERADAPSLRPPRRLGTGDEYFRRIESSRGCQFGRCTFCTRPPGIRDRWSRLPPDRIAGDLERLHRLGVRRFTFTDEDFLGSDTRSAEWIADQVQPYDFTYTVSVRADNVALNRAVLASTSAHSRENLLRRLYRSGLRQVFVGVESLSNSQLRRYGKGSTAQLAVDAIGTLRRHGFGVEIGLVLFDPFTTLDELAESSAALARTGLWRFMGSPFGRMRIQADTAMARSKKYRPVLGAFDADVMSFAWRFADGTVAEVHRRCESWWSPLDDAYRLVRNVIRTQDATAEQICAAQSAVLLLRRNALRMLDATIEAVGRADPSMAQDEISHLTTECTNAFERVATSFERDCHGSPAAAELISHLDAVRAPTLTRRP